MKIHGKLQIILDAELQAGNAIERTESSRAPWHNAIYLAQPFHDSYFSTRRIPGVMRGFPVDPAPGADFEWYECGGDAIMAPMPPRGTHAEFYRRAEREGRALPTHEWMPEPKQSSRQPQQNDLYSQVAAHADGIEAEMRRIGRWSDRPPAPEAFQFTRAFAGDTMSYDQWLQFIFLPRVRQIVAERGQFPSSSSTAAQAVREFDGNDECNTLITKLSAFDELFGAPGMYGGAPARNWHARFLATKLMLFLAVGAWAAFAVWSTGPVVSRLKGFFPPSHSRRIGVSPNDGRAGALTIDVLADVVSDDVIVPRSLSFIMSHDIRQGGFKARILQIDLPDGVCRVLSNPREPDQPWTPAAMEAWLKEEWRRDGRNTETAEFRAALSDVRQWSDHLAASKSPAELKSAADGIANAWGYREVENTAVDLPASVPGWCQAAVLIGLILVGAIPIAAAIVRWYRRPAFVS